VANNLILLMMGYIAFIYVAFFFDLVTQIYIGLFFNILVLKSK